MPYEPFDQLLGLRDTGHLEFVDVSRFDARGTANLATVIDMAAFRRYRIQYGLDGRPFGVRPCERQVPDDRPSARSDRVGEDTEDKELAVCTALSPRPGVRKPVEDADGRVPVEAAERDALPWKRNGDDAAYARGLGSERFHR